MARTPFIGGNWKMNTDRAGATTLAVDVAERTDGLGIDIAVFPPFPYLLTVAEALDGSEVRVGAQDVYSEPNGAFTGEVSAEMLQDCGVDVVLTGHSERRHVIAEPEALIAAKTRAVLEAGLWCILCIGETLQQREAGETDAVNERQLRSALGGVRVEQAEQLTIAYEPVWAIGTGKVAEAGDAQNAQAKVRGVLAELLGSDMAMGIRIQYGGSLKPASAPELFGQADVDGGLVGGASLKAEDFAAICRAAAEV